MNRETTLRDIKTVIHKRKNESHKGNYGRILIAAGSLGMCGAAILAAKGAYRSGAGIVSIVIPENLFTILHCEVWEAVLLDRQIQISNINDYNAMAIGPGMGENQETKDFLLRTLSSYKGPLLLDADALNVLAKLDDYMILKEYPGSLILTPHPGEAKRLLNVSSEEYHSMSRQEVAMSLAKKTGAIIVLKGWNTIIVDPAGEVRINPTGNPGMATGGSGDVLAGVITALLGRGISPYAAAVTGAYLHGLAGDIAVRKLGMTAMIAGDLVEFLAIAFMEIEKGH